MRRWTTALVGSWVALACGEHSPPTIVPQAPIVVPQGRPPAEAGRAPNAVFRPPVDAVPASHPPTIDVPARVTLDEREPLSLRVEVDDPDGLDDVRLFAIGIPPGARWDEDARTMHFRPDFIQGGPDASWTITFIADDGLHRRERSTELVVRDTVRPPWPTIDAEDPGSGFTRLAVSQRTDDFLDAPEYAGRTFDALVTRPVDTSEVRRWPVLILLHGLGEGPRRHGADDRFVISPHDPNNTYWWGYRTEADGAEHVPPYTQRRVLHLLEWVLRHEPSADPDRVFIAGRSMGGAGAATVGLLRARHVAGVDAWLWQAIPRNHRPSRIAHLSRLWGSPAQDLGDGDGMGAWDRMDLTRALLEQPEARDQWLFSRHGKDDPTIHFGAVVLPSPKTGVSLYEALQRTRTGHWVVWDEGAHRSWDPLLGADWWTMDWDPAMDDTTYLRRDQAFVAFSNASHDDEPGDGGNGLQPWHEESGYSGSVESAGDTGWNGDRAGALNQYLRWDTRAMVDELYRFEVPLQAHDDHRGAWPIRVDVTLRRVQAFGCRAGEVVDWSFGGELGEARADEHGELTIPEVPVTASWQVLSVARRR